MLDYNREHGLIYYGGTEYVQGLRENVPKLLEKRARMLTAPKHPYQKNEQVQDWMLTDIEWAIGQYNEL
jgi:hypothetical protein